MSVLSHVSCAVEYGSLRALIEWQFRAGTAPGLGVSVYRSPDGLGDWQIASNPEQLVTNGRFVDMDIGVQDMTQRLSYRLDIELLDGDGSASSVIESVLVHPTPDALRGYNEHKAVRRMLLTEVFRLRRGVGLPCFVYAPLIRPTDLNAPNTVYACPEGDTTYGSFFGHGFSPPYQTWMHLTSQQETRTLEKDGTGMQEQVELTARFPGYPTLRSYYLVVLPGSDRRFVVGERVQAGLYRGVVPITYDVQLHELVRSDPRYRVPVPELQPALASPSFIP